MVDLFWPVCEAFRVAELLVAYFQCSKARHNDDLLINMNPDYNAYLTMYLHM